MKATIKALSCTLLCIALMLSLAAVGASALSAEVLPSSFEGLELKAYFIQSDADIFSDLNEEFYASWWEDEVPELDNWAQTATVNMRGFSMSADGRYLYMGHLNGGTGVRGVSVFDTESCTITDLYYAYDGESAVGMSPVPFSYAKGIAADDRGYVYVGFAYSRNYNVVNLGIARQMEDGTLEEVSYKPVFEFGDPGAEGGIQVGVNGVDVAKVGDKYYCYLMINYTYDALYCIDVTDPASPKVNKDFGQNGCIVFSEPSNTVAGDGFTLKEGQYLDVDTDGTIWLVANSNEGTDGIMKIAPDGSACVEVIEKKGIYSVEHVGGYILCGAKDGSAVTVLDDASYETIATIPVAEGYGDRIVRMQVINDVLFVADAGNDTIAINALHIAPLSPAGQEFYDKLVGNLGKTTEETTEDLAETTATPAEETTEAPTEETTAARIEESTVAPAEETTIEVTEDTASAVKKGCGSVLGFGAVAILSVAAACLVRKKD